MVDTFNKSTIKNATLRQLQIFEVVSRHLNYTRAAEELYLTQPTVSIQLKQLADIVGLPLLEQVGKRIFLTDVGRELQSVVRTLLDELSRFEMSVSNMKGVKAGKLRIAVITTAQYFIPRLLGPFCERFPGIDVTLKVVNRERLLQRLESNEDNLYILGQPPEHIHMRVEPFLENPLVVLASRGHPLAGKSNISAKRIAQEPFLMRESGSGTRLATEGFFKERGLALNFRMELGSNEAIKQAVAGGLGIAVLSAHTLALEKSANELVILDVEGFPIRRQWHVAYSTGKHLSVVAKVFLDFLRQESDATAKRYMQGMSGFPSLAKHKKKSAA
jgi:LysR family transcriptional regulator, low CO2-responsive transcriptional regulator